MFCFFKYSSALRIFTGHIPLIKKNVASYDLFLTCLLPLGLLSPALLGPILYLLYTSDLPATRGVTIDTFADDTVIVAIHENPIEASNILQKNLGEIEAWAKNGNK